VWGWTFKADAARAREFLSVTNATCSGATLTGSGTTTLATSPCFRPGGFVSLVGAVESNVAADSNGRITFHVDLGPAHRLEQYTVRQRVAEGLGDYWTSRTVTFGGN